MNEFLRQFIMKTIREMIDFNKPEWEVRKYALDWYAKGILTEADLQEIDDRYKRPVEVVEEHVEAPIEEIEQLDTEVDSNEQNDTKEEGE